MFENIDIEALVRRVQAVRDMYLPVVGIVVLQWKQRRSYERVFERGRILDIYYFLLPAVNGESVIVHKAVLKIAQVVKAEQNGLIGVKSFGVVEDIIGCIFLFFFRQILVVAFHTEHDGLHLIVITFDVYRKLSRIAGVVNIDGVGAVDVHFEPDCSVRAEKRYVCGNSVITRLKRSRSVQNRRVYLVTVGYIYHFHVVGHIRVRRIRIKIDFGSGICRHDIFAKRKSLFHVGAAVSAHVANEKIVYIVV